jgi:hypothetical protein
MAVIARVRKDCAVTKSGLSACFTSNKIFMRAASLLEAAHRSIDAPAHRPSMIAAAALQRRHLSKTQHRTTGDMVIDEGFIVYLKLMLFFLIQNQKNAFFY